MPDEQSRWRDLASIATTYWPIVTMPSFPAWAVWRYYADKRAAARARKDTLAEKQAEDNAEQRRQLSKDQADYLDRLERQSAAKDARIAALELDRDIGWDKARECHDGWRGAVHDGNNLFTRIVLLVSAGRPLPDPLPELPRPPPLEEIAGRRP